VVVVLIIVSVVAIVKRLLRYMHVLCFLLAWWCV